jgi:hypothetical protein
MGLTTAVPDRRKQVSAYSGLVPRQHQSGDMDRRPAGPTRVQSMRSYFGLATPVLDGKGHRQEANIQNGQHLQARQDWEKEYVDISFLENVIVSSCSLYVEGCRYNSLTYPVITLTSFPG